jgi:hypothetical protein
MSRLKPLFTGLGFAFIILLSIITLLAIFNPALLLSLETQSSNDAYHLTNGLLGTPIQKPPVSFNVGEELWMDKGYLGIGWTNQQPLGGVFEYYGSCKYPTQLYALNITNNANVPIVKIVIRLPGFVTPAPLPHPWVTNETQYSPYLKGNVTSIEIANVNIQPHTTYLLWNASSIGKGVPIYFFFANGSYYETSNYWEPNYPT